MNIVTYYRVSTAKQGASGLGLDAQRAAVNLYAKAHDANILAEFTEVESGKKTDRKRPQLAAALERARLTGAVLVVAKLDRLARNVSFLSKLMDNSVPFIACDNPHATRLVLHILMAVAEAEAGAISQRTKVALAERKKRGLPIGSADPRCRGNLNKESRERGRAAGSKANRDSARHFRDAVRPIALALQAEGKSFHEIGEAMTSAGYRTWKKGKWDYQSVRWLLKECVKRGRDG